MTTCIGCGEEMIVAPEGILYHQDCAQEQIRALIDEVKMRKNAADGAGVVLRQMTDRAVTAEAQLQAAQDGWGRTANELASETMRANRAERRAEAAQAAANPGEAHDRATCAWCANHFGDSDRDREP